MPDPCVDTDRVALGRITGVFGIRGWLKIHAYTRPLENIFDYPRWWIVPGEGKAGFEARLLDGRAQGRGLVAQISGADGQALQDRETSAGLIGAEIQVARAELPPAPRGTYYWADLIGLEVRSESDVVLGRVTAMADNGAQDVLAVDDDGQQRLIPFVIGPIVKAVEPEQGFLVVAWEPDY